MIEMSFSMCIETRIELVTVCEILDVPSFILNAFDSHDLSVFASHRLFETSCGFFIFI